MGKYDFELDLDTENSLSLIVQMMREQSTVLEFGPANGRLTRYLQKNMHCTVDIVEIDETSGKEAAQYSRSALLGNDEGDIEKFIWCDKLKGNRYDYILFADVLEHLKDPQKVLKQSGELLKEDGYILFSVPNISNNAILLQLYDNDFPYKEIGLLDNTHVHFFAYKSIKRMIKEIGFDSIEEKATYCTAENTEFHAGFDKISFSSRKEIKTKEYGNVYQFVFKIAPSDQKRNILEENCIDRDFYYDFACYYKIDGDKEFSERHCKRQYYKPGINEFSVDLSDCGKITALRIDPLSCNCIIKDFCAVDSTTSKPLEMVSTNGYKEEQQYVFQSEDPYFEFVIPQEGIKKLEVSFEVTEYENHVIENLFRKEIEKNECISRLEQEKNKLEKDKNECICQLENELNKYKEHYLAAIHQREELKNQVEVLNLNYTTIINSECWKLTAPLRFVLQKIKDICRSNRVLYLTAKGMKSLFTDGFRATWYKVKQRKISQKDNVEFAARLTLTPEERKEQEKKKFKRDILFSIIVPLYNTPKDFLKEMMESVQNQTYGKWELCLADGSDNQHSYVKRICKEYAKKDHRIKYRKLSENLGISENTNKALEMAKGQYIGLFDHDDLLHPAALYEYMEVICRKNADFIYCDELTFVENLEHITVIHCKPDYAIDNLRANNYICHFSVFRKELLDQVGGFRKEFDGSQDHDMIFRLTEAADTICHIPKILYFWRSHKNSVASNIGSKSYAVTAGIRAVKAHLERMGIEAEVESSAISPSIYRIHYQLLERPLISIVIPNKDYADGLKKCIDSILTKTTYDHYEIIVIENNSVKEETFALYQKLEQNEKIRVVQYEAEGEFNYSAINNFGIKYANGKHIVLLNNDIEIISENWLEEMLMFSQRDDVGAVGAKLYYPDDTIQHAGVIIGMGGIAGHAHRGLPRSSPGYMGRAGMQQDYSAVTAACLMVKKSVFDEVGGLDEVNFKVAFNDIDLCMKIRKSGYLNVWTPYAEAYHYESVSRGLEDTPEKQKRFQGEIAAFESKWGKELENGDPYYNVNLALDKTDFSLR